MHKTHQGMTFNPASPDRLYDRVNFLQPGTSICFASDGQLPRDFPREIMRDSTDSRLEDSYQRSPPRFTLEGFIVASVV